MDAKLDKIRSKIEKLTEQQNKIEQKYITSVAKLVKNVTAKGIDIRLITGMILNVEQMINVFPDKREEWQNAGEKFLVKPKNKASRSKLS